MSQAADVFRYAQIALAITLFCVSPSVSRAQIFDYDFSDPSGNVPSGYTYAYAYGGYGPADCSMNIAATTTGANPEISSSTVTVDSLQGFGEFSNWLDAGPGGPAEPQPTGSACWNYAGMGAGIGHVLGYTDSTTGELVFNKQLDSNDLSEYVLKFDAWADGLLVPQGDTTINVQFQGPDGNGGLETKLAIGTTPQLEEVGLSAAMTLTSTPQTFTIQLDTLQELSSPDDPSLFTMNGDPVPEQGGTGPGSYAAWQAGSWMDTTQFQFQLQVAGTLLTFGLDDNNVIHIDNATLSTASDQPLTCDFDGDGQCELADIDMLYGNWGAVGGQFDLDGSGVVDSGEIGAWLGGASSASNPYNAAGNTFLIGDLDLDGDIDSTDLGVLLNKFGDMTGLLYGAGNLNDDMNVDSADLGLQLNGFGFTSAASSVVPEPQMLPLLAFAILGFVAISTDSSRKSRLKHGKISRF